jgi:hypothetical protein
MLATPMLAVLLRCEPCRQQRGPTVIGLGSGACAVGDGIAVSHNQRRVGGRHDIDAGQPVVGLRLGRIRQRRLGGDVAFLYIGGVQRGGMIGLRTGLAGEVETHRQIGQRREVEIHGVAHGHDARSDGAARFAVEGKRAVRRWDDFGILTPNGDMGRSQDQRRASEGVRNLDPHAPPADAGAHHHAHRLVIEPARVGRLGSGSGGWGRRADQ